MSDAGEVLVGRCYTRAVKLPSMMGQIHGVRLVGGPYSVAQVVAMAAALALVGFSYPVWAPLGLGVGGSLLLIVGVPVGVGVAVRGLQAGGQQLLVTVPGALGALAGPRGKLGGRPLPHRRRARPLAGAWTVSGRTHPFLGGVAEAPRGGRAARAAGAAAQVPRHEVNPKVTTSAGRPVVLSGAGALLQRRASGGGR